MGPRQSRSSRSRDEPSTAYVVSHFSLANILSVCASKCVYKCFVNPQHASLWPCLLLLSELLRYLCSRVNWYHCKCFISRLNRHLWHMGQYFFPPDPLSLCHSSQPGWPLSYSSVAPAIIFTCLEPLMKREPISFSGLIPCFFPFHCSLWTLFLPSRPPHPIMYLLKKPSRHLPHRL